eukprot:TRINITY_DN66424_c0_g1_i1.p1 TRINITY_DN66424_c0_g1~~TRINITY_DN66424_c0_g1_i1.p1  ORF type:complete len:100 (-),score=16.02 TRINITY_DN66424_c0_g1_i1:158-457(-)
MYLYHLNIHVQYLFSPLGFFFFKQKTAYEMLRSLVGSEMCIRDSLSTVLISSTTTALVCSSTAKCWGLLSLSSCFRSALQVVSMYIPVLCVDTLSLIHI